MGTGWFTKFEGESLMIALTKLNDAPFVLNSDLIETIEENPDTTIKLTTRNIVIVRESMTDVVNKVIEYRRLINGTITLKPFIQQ
jgi:flagellar protein FlbD